MALIELQQPFGSFRGRDEVVGGQVLYPAGGRQFARTFVQPTNPQTPDQQIIRGFMTIASQGYSALDSTEKASWLALAPQMQRTDPNGNSYSPTAKGLYVGVNSYRQMDTLGLGDTAPPAVIQAAALTLVEAELTIGGGNLRFEWTHANIDGFFFLEWTPALPGLTRLPRDTDFRRYGGTFDAAIRDQDTSPQGSSPTVASLQFPVLEGARHGFRVTSLSPGYLKGQQLTGVLTITQEV